MRKNTGVLLTLTAGILWGFSGACGQYIFDTFGADASYLTAARMLSAGVLLIIMGFFTDRKGMTGIWKDRTSVLRLVIFALGGLLLCQLSYMKAIAYSNSGTATILQYQGPVLVMVVSCLMAKKLPEKKEVLAIVLALTGTFLIATHGNPASMVITPLGLSWGMFSAVALMLYTLLPVRLAAKYSSIVITGYGMFIAGLFLCAASGIWKAPVIHDFRCLAAFAAIVVFGTVMTFTMYLRGVAACGPVKASMLASVEPVSAAVFMVVWLKEPFQFIDLVGFACIFVTVFLLAKKES